MTIPTRGSLGDRLVAWKTKCSIQPPIAATLDRRGVAAADPYNPAQTGRLTNEILPKDLGA